MENFFWVNDQLVAQSDAHVSVLDHGFTVADGVFETIKIASGKTFAESLHLDRLDASCDGLGIERPDRDLVSKAINEVLSASPIAGLGRVRVTVTSGVGPLGSDRTSGPQTLVVAATSQKAWPDQSALALVPWVRNERSAIVGLKTTSYAENVIALQAAHDVGCSEALFLDSRGNVSEGTGSNIFWVTAGQVFTPADSTGLLKGITRGLVIELCTRLGMSCVEGEFGYADVMTADEVFITSSTRDVMPVTLLKALNSDRVSNVDAEYQIGEVTRSLVSEFIRAAAENPDPKRGEFSQ